MRRLVTPKRVSTWKWPRTRLGARSRYNDRIWQERKVKARERPSAKSWSGAADRWPKVMTFSSLEGVWKNGFLLLLLPDTRSPEQFEKNGILTATVDSFLTRFSTWPRNCLTSTLPCRLALGDSMQTINLMTWFTETTLPLAKENGLMQYQMLQFCWAFSLGFFFSIYLFLRGWAVWWMVPRCHLCMI